LQKTKQKLLSGNVYYILQ